MSGISKQTKHTSRTFIFLQSGHDVSISWESDNMFCVSKRWCSVINIKWLMVGGNFILENKYQINAMEFLFLDLFNIINAQNVDVLG